MDMTTFVALALGIVGVSMLVVLTVCTIRAKTVSIELGPFCPACQYGDLPVDRWTPALFVGTPRPCALHAPRYEAMTADTAPATAIDIAQLDTAPMLHEVHA